MTFQKEERQLNFWEPANFWNNEGSLPPPRAQKHLARLLTTAPLLPNPARSRAPRCLSHTQVPLTGPGMGARGPIVEKNGHFLWSVYQMGITQPLTIFTSPAHGN